MLKSGAKRLFRRLGLDVQRLTRGSIPQLRRQLEERGIGLVFDVGANRGQFATELRAAGYGGDIVSFEPLSEAHHHLAARARRDPRWHVHERCAVGQEPGEITMNVAGNSVSSSVLPMLPAHAEAAPASRYVGAERAPVVTLDSVAGPYLRGEGRCFIKIDTQGYEWQVLDGAKATLARCDGLLCELSLVPLYRGQRLWLELIDRVQASGFALWALGHGFIDPRNGRLLQLDATFYRESGS